MNYKSLFSCEGIASALFSIINTEKYKKLKVKSFSDIESSGLTKHYRNKRNFWKGVCKYVVNNNSKELHRFTEDKYSKLCYFEFRNKKKKIEQVFNTISGTDGSKIYI